MNSNHVTAAIATGVLVTLGGLALYTYKRWQNGMNGKQLELDLDSATQASKVPIDLGLETQPIEDSLEPSVNISELDSMGRGDLKSLAGSH